MTVALTIASTKAGDRVKLTLECLSNGTLHPLCSFTEDYAVDGSFFQQIVNMPVRPLVSSKMVV